MSQFAFKKPTVLVVDDDPSIIKLIERVLTKEFGDEIDLLCNEDPAVARERINKGGIGILITDLDMPEIDGIELLRSAKDRDASTQVIFLTGESTHESLMQALEYGAGDYLLKPIQADQLIDRVRESKDRQRRWQHALGQTWRERKCLSHSGK